MGVEVSIFNFINGFVGKWWPFDWLGIFLGGYLNYFLILIAIFLLIKEKNWRERIYFFSLSALSVILARGIITEAIRFFYYRPRPFLALQIQPLLNHDLTGSFPSGHATAYFALALAIFYFDKKWGKRALVMASLIGLGRVFVGVHWPLDVLIGAAIGLGSAFLIRKILPVSQADSTDSQK